MGTLILEEHTLGVYLAVLLSAADLRPPERRHHCGIEGPLQVEAEMG
jgi:hypothetical protein